VAIADRDSACVEPGDLVGQSAQARLMGYQQHRLACGGLEEPVITFASATGSRPVVGSSGSSSGASRSSARATAIRRRWPPASCPPCSPTSVS